MKPHGRTKLVEAVRQLEITHGTQHFPRALSNVFMEMADVFTRPKSIFKKFGKPKNYEAMWRNTHRIEQFHDPLQQ